MPLTLEGPRILLRRLRQVMADGGDRQIRLDKIVELIAASMNAAAIHAIKWPMYMPAAEAHPYFAFLAYRKTERSDIPICMAALQNQANRKTLQNPIVLPS